MTERELKVNDKIVIHNYNIEGLDEIFLVKDFVNEDNEVHMVVVSIDDPNNEVSLRRETSGLWNLVTPKENVNKDLTINFLGGDPGLLDALLFPFYGYPYGGYSYPYRGYGYPYRGYSYPYRGYGYPHRGNRYQHRNVEHRR